MNIFSRKPAPRPSMPDNIDPVPLAHCYSTSARDAFADFLTNPLQGPQDHEILIFDRHLRASIYARGKILNLAPVFLKHSDTRIRVMMNEPEDRTKFLAKHPFARLLQEEAGASIAFTEWKPTTDFIIRGDDLFFKNAAVGLRFRFNSGSGFVCLDTSGTASENTVRNYRQKFEKEWQEAEILTPTHS